MAIKLLFNCSHESMLMGAYKAAEAGKLNSNELQIAQENWTVEYFSDFQVRVNDVSVRFLGEDYRQLVKRETSWVYASMEKAKNWLRVVRNQIEVHFDDDEQILDALGYSKYWSKISKNEDQEQMVGLLETFRRHIKEYMPLFQEKGMSMKVLEMIVGFASELKTADRRQEIAKDTSKERTAEAYEHFNAIYKEAIGICKIGQAVFHDDPIKRDMFTFSKILEKMDNRRPKEKGDESSEIVEE